MGYFKAIATLWQFFLSFWMTAHQVHVLLAEVKTVLKIARWFQMIPNDFGMTEPWVPSALVKVKTKQNKNGVPSHIQHIQLGRGGAAAAGGSFPEEHLCCSSSCHLASLNSRRVVVLQRYGRWACFPCTMSLLKLCLLKRQDSFLSHFYNLVGWTGP